MNSIEKNNQDVAKVPYRRITYIKTRSTCSLPESDSRESALLKMDAPIIVYSFGLNIARYVQSSRVFNPLQFQNYILLMGGGGGVQKMKKCKRKKIHKYF